MQPRTQKPDLGHLPPAAFRGKVTRAMPCKACGAMIRYLRTENGKRLPINDEPVKVTPAMLEAGPVRLVDPAGHVREHEAKEEGYVSHWGTCPHAARFRRPKSKQAPEPAAPAKGLTDIHGRVKYIADTVSRLARAAGAQKAELKHLSHYCDRTLTMLEGLPS